MIVTPGLALRSVSTSAGRWVSFEVVPLGLVGTLCEPGSQGHQTCSTAGRSVFCQVGSLWSKTGCFCQEASREFVGKLCEAAELHGLGHCLCLGGPKLSQCRELGDPLVPSAFSEALCRDI